MPLPPPLSIETCSAFDLGQAWQTHKKGYGVEGLAPESGCMLLFYAVECGLKALLIRNRRETNCPKNGKNLLYSHNLNNILRELKPSGAEMPEGPATLHLKTKTGAVTHPNGCDIHLAWRYGVTVDPQNEQEIINWLEQVNRWIEQRMRNP